MTKKQKLGRTIAKAREVMRLTVDELAEKSGVGCGTILFAEAGEAVPRMSELTKLGAVLQEDAIEWGILAGHLTRAVVKRHIERQAA